MRSVRRGQMCVILYMKLADVSATRADTQTWESVQTGKLLLIGQRLVVAQTGRPRTPQGQVNNFGHITRSV